MKYCTVCQAKYEDSVSFCPVDGEVLEDDLGSIVGTVLDGQYQIESMLGKGGMGAVYRARHILLGDRVAIKVLPSEVRNNAEWLRRFRREGQAARRFRHPNAVTVYDLRTANDGTIYMVMEYVEGHTLDAELKRRGRFTPAEAVEVLDPIMSVLNTAHSMGVVHRDLKPENIMIGTAAQNGERLVKLLDLGIAKMREIAGADSAGTTALTMAGQVLGTPYYMSPEQWGEIPPDGNSEIDGRSDIYSLGLVVYELVAGHRPCSGATLSELRRQHVSVTLQPLHKVQPDVSAEFSLAVSRATAKDRADRQQTAGELAAELRLALGGVAPTRDRTVQDIPLTGSSAPTNEIPQAKQTAADGDAPTIITVDSPPIAPWLQQEREPTPTPPPVETPAPFNLKPSHESAATVYESAGLPSSVTLPQQQKAASAQPRRGSLVFAGAGAVILVLLVLVVGSVFAYIWFKGSSEGAATTDRGSTNGRPATTTVKEIGRYWLELARSDGQSVQVAGVVPLASGQQFKFHFRLAEDGYLYILGPGEGNQPTTFLTSEPAEVSGVENNQVKKDIEFSFPAGPENWMQLDEKPGAEDYTIIFSPAAVMEPKFLNAQAGNVLTAAEQVELANFLAQNKSKQITSEVNDKNSTDPHVLVKVPRGNEDGKPTVFQIRIEHK